jgi:hypothetical protein
MRRAGLSLTMPGVARRRQIRWVLAIAIGLGLAVGVGFALPT